MNKKKIISIAVALALTVLIIPTAAFGAGASVIPGENGQAIWDFLVAKGLPETAAAGVMGNMYQESGFEPTNLQDWYNIKFGYTDAAYTEASDNGSWDFVNDAAGYGLCQWTYYTRKQGLYDYAKSLGVSVGSLQAQLGFCWQELGSPAFNYKGESLIDVLKDAEKEPTIAEQIYDATETFYYLYEGGGSYDGTFLKRVAFSEAIYLLYSGSIPVVRQGNKGLGAASGDVDCDGSVTTSDARLVLRAAIEIEPIAEGTDRFAAADVDCDGTLTVIDARLVLRRAVGIGLDGEEFTF